MYSRLCSAWRTVFSNVSKLQNHTWQNAEGNPDQVGPRKSGKFSISLSSTRSDRHKAQDPLEMEIKHPASTNVKIETSENQECQSMGISTQAARAPQDQKFVAEDTILRHTFNPLSRVPLQNPPHS